MFENVTLTELDDSQLADVLDSVGKGKPAVYKKPIRELLATANGSQGSVAVPWSTVNPAAEKRATVITGLRAAIGRDKTAKDRMAVVANTDDALITIVIRAESN
jgi:hypothetical protein